MPMDTPTKFDPNISHVNLQVLLFLYNNNILAIHVTSCFHGNCVCSNMNMSIGLVIFQMSN